MKRFVMSLMVVVGALLSACTEEPDSLPTAGLSGTFDVALVAGRQLSESQREADLLFVTSADRNELRVLDLTADAVSRGYVRAPNPLEALSVPVLPRPQALTRDMRYNAEGSEVGGSYLFARSNGSAAISVVASNRDFLREVLRLNDPSVPGEGRQLPRQLLLSTGPVTAFAARGNEDGSSTLYYASREVTGARLWEVRVPAPQALVEGTETVQGGALVVALPPDVVVSSLLVLPQSGQLALATRGAVGTTGQVFTLTLPGGTLTALNFGGSQVLQLATHGRVSYQLGTDAPIQTLPAGARIFGVLDPASCGGVRFPCPSGVLAVEAATGTVARDFSARDPLDTTRGLYEMLPITAGLGVPMGLTLASNTELALTGRLALVGIVPLSNGEILVFDALGLRQLDVDTDDVPSATVTFVNPVGSVGIAGDITVDTAALTSGVTTNERYQLTYQGILPRMSNETAKGFVVPYAPFPGRGPVVQPGDFIVLRTATEVCATDLVVATVQPPVSPATQAVLTTNTPIPPECADFSIFTNFLVRAGGSQPLVISSSTAEYLGRVGPGDPYTATGPYFFHPDNYTGATQGVAVRFTVASRFTEVTPERGNAFLVTTQSQFLPYTLLVDTSIPDLSFFTLPGSVVEAKVGITNYAYIAYPSADGLLQMDLDVVVPTVLNSRGVFPFL
ncbi:hypothetical protein [Archangium sp.]|uniref:hypothetical protein n=1 Tax=Archangium sp. TaxID=1872627 RepID=UPI00286BDF58|nr:hypothetical protein [Archangium sp.]